MIQAKATNLAVSLLLIATPLGAESQSDSPRQHLLNSQNSVLLDRVDKLPSQEFSLAFTDESISTGSGHTVPTLQPGYDKISTGVRVFPNGIALNTKVRVRWLNSNAIAASESSPLHTLCDSSIHIAYLPIEQITILHSAGDIVVLRTLTAEESKNPYNENASIACLAPRPDGGYRTMIHMTQTVFEGKGRFECAISTPIKQVIMINPKPAPYDNFGLSVDFITPQSKDAYYIEYPPDQPVLEQGEITVPKECR